MIAAIETGMLARLKAAVDGGTLGYHPTFASYGGEFDEDIHHVVRKFPAIWVTFSGEDGAEVDNTRFEARPTFSVLVGARSVRNEQASRHGAAGSIGTYQMIEDVKALFTNQRLDLDIDPLEFVRTRSLFNGRVSAEQMSVFAVEFRTRYALDLPDPAESLTDLSTFHADWDVPPHGNVTPPLPADQPDAEDTVTGLEQ